MENQYSKRIHFIDNCDNIHETKDTVLVCIDCSSIYTTKELFKQLSEKLKFPFIVTNWNGFIDFLWDLEQFKVINNSINNVYVYIYNIKNVLKNENYKEKKIFFEVLNNDYIVNEDDEQGKTNFPVNIQLYFNQDEEKYFIPTEPKIIWDSNDN